MASAGTNLTDILLGEDRPTIIGIIQDDAIVLTNKTLDNISNYIGANHIHYRCRNSSGVTITAGTVVTAQGTQSGTDYLEIVPVTDPQTQVAIGIAHSDLLNNAVGLVINTGVLNDHIDTSGFSEGTILYPNTTGGLTSVKPTSGQYQACAVVTRSHATQGTLLIEFTDPKKYASTTQAGYVQLVDNLTTNDNTKALTASQGFALKALVDRIDTAIVLMGVWDASVGTFPTSANAGESWIVSVGGTVNGIEFTVNDRVMATVDGASTTIYASNWHKLDYTDAVLSVDGLTGAIDLSGTYEPKDATILKNAHIGTTVQAYDADTTKNDVANTFTAPQRTSITAEDNAIDLAGNNNFELTATATNITATNIASAIGQSGIIIVHTAENITGWATEFKFKSVPTDLTGDEVFAYFVEDATNIWIGRVQ